MQQFREYLEEEGMPTDDMYEITIPIKNNFKKEEIGKLKYLKIQDGADFKKSGEKIELDIEDAIKSDSGLVCESTGYWKLNLIKK